MVVNMSSSDDTHICSLGSHNHHPKTTSTTKFFLDWTEHHDCAGLDWFVLVALLILVHLLSWLPRWFLYEPFLFSWWRRKRRNNNDNKVNNSDPTIVVAKKFSQVLSQASFHILMGIFAWRILGNKDWIWNSNKWSDDHIIIMEQNHHPQRIYDNDRVIVSNMIEDVNFKFYYLLYATRYISDLISLFFEPTRSDTFAYAIHHIVTIILVLLSAMAGCTRIGGVLMLFFDWADPPMLIGKAFLYLSENEENNTTKFICQQIADICMGIFVFLFVTTRNILFTGIVIQIMLNDDFSPSASYPQRRMMLLLLKTMLVVLVLLMTFWFGLICKTIYNQFFKNQGHVEDIREKEEGCHHDNIDNSKKSN